MKYINSVMILDDEQNSLDMMSLFVQTKIKPKRIIGTSYPTEAKKLALSKCFDMILIDVTLEYKGSTFGGLELYEELVGRYGAASMMAYSGYINDDLLRKYQIEFNFIRKFQPSGSWMDYAYGEITKLRTKQSCFVAMPFDVKYDPVFNVIERCVTNAGYICIRLDREQFTKSIVEQIFLGIRECKLLIFLATDKNPNVFFEAGFALALNKEIVTIVEKYDELPFDIRDRNTISYDKGLDQLENRLEERLTKITHVR